MLKLTFETANFGTSAALVLGRDVLEKRCWEKPYGQASYLVPELKTMVSGAGYTLSQVDAVVTTLGPGSFTGQRLGLCIAQTLAFAGGLCVWGVSSFEWPVKAYLRAYPENSRALLVCLKTGRSDLFCQLFDEKGRVAKDPLCLLPSEMETYAGQEVLVIGQDLDRVPSHIDTRYFIPHALDLAYIERPERTTLAPFYLRGVEATPAGL